MKVISMVPSWTETLIGCGVDVVGRTRFCIHPSEKVKAVPVVGGTKDIDWNKVREIKPDFLLLDKEENPKQMAAESPVPVIITHIQKVANVAEACRQMSQTFANEALLRVATRWEALRPHPPRLDIATNEEIPALLAWGHKPSRALKSFTYIIWKKPWMAVSRKTFIGSVFDILGYGNLMVDFEKPYPEVTLAEFNQHETLLLFSSEPYPFFKKQGALRELPFSWAVVDGESLSWFGVRSLLFLENYLSESRNS